MKGRSLAVLSVVKAATSNWSFSILLFLFVQVANGQSIQKSIAILEFTSENTSAEGTRITSIYQSKVTSCFVRDKRFVVVERNKLHLLEKERELQKNEDFINGKVVQQGLSIGADFLITGYCNFTEGNLSLTLYDVASGKTVGKDDFKLVMGDELTELVTYSFVEKYFPLSRIKVVKMLEETKKGETVLIAGGTKVGIINKERLTVIELVYEELDGELIERERDVGVLLVSKIENENFSVCTIKEGEKVITEKIRTGGKLYCKRTSF